MPGAGDGARCGARGAVLRERSSWPHGQLGGWTVPVRCFLGGSDRRHDQRPSIARTRTRAQVLVGIGCGPLLAATFNGRCRALDTPQLLRAFFALPLVTLKIVAAIHWEALLLWAKGARLVPRHNAALDPRLATAKSRDYTSPALSARG